MTRDKWLLTGAWAAMAAFGALTYYKVSHSPKIDPGVAAAIEALKKAEQDGGCYPPGKAVPFKPPFGPTDAGLAYIDPEANRFHPKFRKTEVDHQHHDVMVLPRPKMSAAGADLNGVSLVWSVEARTVPLLYWMHQKEAKVQGFIVTRQRGEEAPVQIAELGPTATSYADLSAEPRQTYRYIVSVKGMEHDRTTDPPVLKPAMVPAAQAVPATPPSATRLKLAGGDKTHGVLRVETYDRAKKMWVAGKTMLVAPGETVAGIGWTLKGLRFDNFTLVADVTDGDGAALVLTTRE